MGEDHQHDGARSDQIETPDPFPWGLLMHLRSGGSLL